MEALQHGAGSAQDDPELEEEGSGESPMGSMVRSTRNEAGWHVDPAEVCEQDSEVLHHRQDGEGTRLERLHQRGSTAEAEMDDMSDL